MYTAIFDWGNFNRDLFAILEMWYAWNENGSANGLKTSENAFTRNKIVQFK